MGHGDFQYDSLIGAQLDVLEPGKMIAVRGKRKNIGFSSYY